MSAKKTRTVKKQSKTKPVKAKPGKPTKMVVKFKAKRVTPTSPQKIGAAVKPVPSQTTAPAPIFSGEERLICTMTETCPEGRIASKFQKGVIAWAMGLKGKRTKQHAVIEAVAGSGKTTMLEELAIRLNGSIVYLVFNNKNAREAQEKFDKLVAAGKIKPGKVLVKTFNSFGNGVVRDNLGYRVVSEWKTDDILKYDVIGKDAMGTSEGRKEFFRNRGPIATMVKLMKNLALGMDDANDVWPGEPKVKEVAEKYDILLPTNGDYTRFIELLRLTWEKATDPTRKKIDFEDQLFIPVMMKCRMPKFDYVLVDESQDANMLRILTAGMLRDSGATLIFVGDPHQAIYHFQGADAQAMNTIKKMFSPVELPLSLCYRCGKKQVELAKMLFPEIEAWEGADNGKVEDLPANWQEVAQPGDFVICRLTAPLMVACLKMIRAGKKAVVLGKNIGQDLVQFLQTAAYKYNDPMTGLVQRLRMFRDEQAQKLIDMDREDSVELLNDKVETINALLESVTLTGNIVTDIEVVKSKVEQVFSEDVCGVTFSSIHRVKGLETDNLFVIDTARTLPYPKAKGGERLLQEFNLAYIAMTRSRKNTYWQGGVADWTRIVGLFKQYLASLGSDADL